jgi:uncharacterized protein with HEPN domain
MEKIKPNWDLKELTETLSKTEEYANQNSLKTLIHQYGTLDLYLKKLEKIKEALKADILQEFEKRFGHQGYTYINEDTNEALQRIIQIRQTICDDKVKKLFPDKWDMIKKEIVDSEKFFDAIKLGVIPAHLVQDAVTGQEINKLAYKEIK